MANTDNLREWSKRIQATLTDKEREILKKYFRQRPAMADRLDRALRWAWEYRARWLHILKVEQKRCPFCALGFFMKPLEGTGNLLVCSYCGSTARKNHYE